VPLETFVQEVELVEAELEVELEVEQ